MYEHSPMPKSTLTKRIEFSASHFYRNPDWDADKNRQTFGGSVANNRIVSYATGFHVGPS